jgi:hypothetical protein
MVSLNTCALKREPLRVPIRIEIKERSRGERRRRSLRRGIDLWHVDTSANLRARARVALIALTVAADDPMVARGAIRDFWHAFRDKYGRSPYFSWAELQHRGAIHYHAIIADSPWKRRRDAVRWIQAHWKLATIQPSYETRDRAWFIARAGDYVKAYAKEKWRPYLNQGTPGRVDKSYQQDYDQLPREIRTWECARLSHRVREVMQHTDRVETVCTALSSAPWHVRARSYWIYERVRHAAKRPEWCTLSTNKSGGANPHAPPLIQEDPGDKPTMDSRFGSAGPVERTRRR